MGHMSRENIVDVTFYCSFFSRCFNQPIRCTDLIEVKNYFSHLLIYFAKCLPACYADQYLNMTYGTWTECRNRDPVFGFRVSRPHLETGERCTKQYSDRTENCYELTHWHLKVMVHPSMFQTEEYKSRQILSNFYSFN